MRVTEVKVLLDQVDLRLKSGGAGDDIVVGEKLTKSDDKTLVETERL